jgi:hypothetical protein
MLQQRMSIWTIQVFIPLTEFYSQIEVNLFTAFIEVAHLTDPRVHLSQIRRRAGVSLGIFI